MIWIIFTESGLQEAKATLLAEQASVWINPSLLETADIDALKQAGLIIEVLPSEVDGGKEKPVIAALTHVEQHSPKGAEIYIEYV